MRRPGKTLNQTREVIVQFRIVNYRLLFCDLRGGLTADFDVLLRREQIEAGLEILQVASAGSGQHNRRREYGNDKKHFPAHGFPSFEWNLIWVSLMKRVSS